MGEELERDRGGVEGEREGQKQWKRLKKTAADLQYYGKVRQRGCRREENTRTALYQNITSCSGSPNTILCASLLKTPTDTPSTTATYIHPASQPPQDRAVMMLWSISRALCVVSACVSLTLAYDDDIQVDFGNSYYNEIIEEEPQNGESVSVCGSHCAYTQVCVE